MEGRKSFVLAAGIPQMASLRATSTRILGHAMLGLGHASPKLPTSHHRHRVEICKSIEMDILLRWILE